MYEVSQDSAEARLALREREQFKMRRLQNNNLGNHDAFVHIYLDRVEYLVE